MTECYRYAMDTYEQMNDDEKAKISLELLYNAICYYHGDASEIVQKLIHMDQPTLAKLGKSLADMRRHVKKLHKATLAAMPASGRSMFATGEVEDIIFYRLSNGLEIK